ncbi:MAG: hypothetical protein OCC49_14755 [Fibrobacterales bacterium]
MKLLFFFVFTLLVSYSFSQENPDDYIPSHFSGVNSIYSMPGLHYGTLPINSNDVYDPSTEFRKKIDQIGVKALRYPGGTDALTHYLVSPDDAGIFIDQMKSVSIRYSKPFPNDYNPDDDLNGLWQFLDFCLEQGITPIFQLNTMLFSDGDGVYQFAGEQGKPFNYDNIIYDTSIEMKLKAALAVKSLVLAVKNRGYSLVNWEIGNEEYDKTHKPAYAPTEYAGIVKLFSEAINEIDPYAKIWVTLAPNFYSKDSDGDKIISPEVVDWSLPFVEALKNIGISNEIRGNLGFTLHYVDPNQILKYESLVWDEGTGFEKRFAITEFFKGSMENSAYSWTTPRYEHATQVAKYLIDMSLYSSIDLIFIHELSGQNAGIMHFHQKSSLETIDTITGDTSGVPGYDYSWRSFLDHGYNYKLMPTAYVYELFKEISGNKIVQPAIARGDKELSYVMTSKNNETFMFLNNMKNSTIQLNISSDLTGTNTNGYEIKTILPSPDTTVFEPDTGDVPYYWRDVKKINQFFSKNFDEDVSVDILGDGIASIRFYSFSELLYDDFSNSKDVVPSYEKWIVENTAESSVIINNGYAKLISNKSWDKINLVSKKKANFFHDGGIARYTIEVSQPYYIIYGWREVEIMGENNGLVLKWTTDYRGGFVNDYELIHRNNPSNVLWSASRSWDQGQVITFTLNDAVVNMKMIDLNPSNTPINWVDVTLDHGLLEKDFPSGGSLRMYATKNMNAEYLYINEAKIEQADKKPLFYDNFIGENDSYIDLTKWKPSTPGNTSVLINSSKAELRSNEQWSEASIESRDKFDFITSGNTLKFSFDFDQEYTLYGWRKFDIVGKNSSTLQLQWTTEYENNAYYNKYKLLTTGSNSTVIWSDKRAWDNGQSISITLNNKMCKLKMLDLGSHSPGVWVDTLLTHSLSENEFDDGGAIRFTAYKYTTNEVISVDNFKVQYVNSIPLFSDDFNSDDTNIDFNKWSIVEPTGNSISIEDSKVKMHSNIQWNELAISSDTKVDFFNSSSNVTYMVDFKQGYTVYGWRKIMVEGTGGAIVLEWTTDYRNGALYNDYVLKTTGTSPQTLWSGSRQWDIAQRVAITLNKNSYSLSMYDLDPNKTGTWVNVSGEHGLYNYEFPDGGALKCTAMRNSNSEIIYFDNVRIETD